MSSAAAHEPTPARIGRFRILRVLAAGDVSTVYVAHDELHDRTVALKVLSNRCSDAERRRRWHREARAMARVSHPNVMPIHDVGIDDDHVFIAMDLVSGGNLRDVLRRRRLSVSECVELFARIARGLQAVHDAGLVHLAFKPQSVLIAPDTRPLLTDFGLTRPRAETGACNEPGPARGAPRYVSPEQVAKRPLTSASNQFSFGVALYEALFSRHPFVHTDVASLHDEVLHGHVVPSHNRSVPARVEAAVRRCLQTDPGDRFGSMKEVADVLEAGIRPTTLLVTAALCAGVGLALVAQLPV